MFIRKLLDTYPGIRTNAKRKDYECFQRNFSQYLERLDTDYHFARRRYYEPNRFPQNDFCRNLEFLVERIPNDFSWMRNQDPEAYLNFIKLVGLVRQGPLEFIGLTHHLHNDLRTLRNKVSPERSETQPSKEEIMKLFEEYKKRSMEQLDCIRTSAWAVGLKLLSITEYDEALQKEGSLNPNLFVIGEVAMSQDTYNVHQAAAVGKNARSDNNNFYLSPQQSKNLAEAAKEIQNLLEELEKSNSHATEDQKICYVNDNTTPNFKRRVVSALQAGGETAIDEFILENKYLKVVKEVLKDWIKSGQTSKNIAEAAQEIKNLPKQLEKSNFNATEDQKIVYVNDNTTPSFKHRVASALQVVKQRLMSSFWKTK